MFCPSLRLIILAQMRELLIHKEKKLRARTARPSEMGVIRLPMTLPETRTKVPGRTSPWTPSELCRSGVSKPPPGSDAWLCARSSSSAPCLHRGEQTASPWVSVPETPPGEPSSSWERQLAAEDEQDRGIGVTAWGAASSRAGDIASARGEGGERVVQGWRWPCRDVDALEPERPDMGFLRQSPSQNRLLDL